MASLIRNSCLGGIFVAFTAASPVQACLDFPGNQNAPPGETCADAPAQQEAVPQTRAAQAPALPLYGPRRTTAAVPQMQQPALAPFTILYLGTQRYEDVGSYPLPFPGGCFNCPTTPSNQDNVARSLFRAHAFSQKFFYPLNR
jgi:hypothetical protein